MMLPNISDFIKNYVTKRENSFFDNDLKNNKEKLTKEIKGKSILVIGGAGTIGSSYIKAWKVSHARISRVTIKNWVSVCSRVTLSF